MSLHFGWSLTILGSLGAVSRVGKNVGDSFQKRAREALGCYSYRTSTTTHSSSCLWLGTKIIGGQQFRLSRCFRDLLIRRGKLQTRLFAAVLPAWLVQESFRHWTKTIIFSNITLVRTDLGHSVNHLRAKSCAWLYACSAYLSGTSSGKFFSL